MNKVFHLVSESVSESVCEENVHQNSLPFFIFFDFFFRFLLLYCPMSHTVHPTPVAALRSLLSLTGLFFIIYNLVKYFYGFIWDDLIDLIAG